MGCGEEAMFLWETDKNGTWETKFKINM